MNNYKYLQTFCFYFWQKSWKCSVFWRISFKVCQKFCVFWYSYWSLFFGFISDLQTSIAMRKKSFCKKEKPIFVANSFSLRLIPIWFWTPKGPQCALVQCALCTAVQPLAIKRKHLGPLDRFQKAPTFFVYADLLNFDCSLTLQGMD